MQRVLDQWLGWHIHWQTRYYSSATVLQIVFQVLGISRVTLEAFMSLVRVGPSVCHQCRGSLPAEQEERGHGDLVVLAWEECEATAKRCHTKLELMVSSFLKKKRKTVNFLKAVFSVCISLVVSKFSLGGFKMSSHPLYAIHPHNLTDAV